MEQVNGKAGKTVQTFDEFNASRKARSEAELAELSEAAERPAKRKRKPVEVKEESLADVLLRAIRIVNARRGRPVQAERIREATLMEVLADAVKIAE
jgi:uncharacterized membrane protein